MLSCQRRQNQRRRGATVFETAVVVGLCFTILLGTFEYARVIMMRNLVENAAREGARLAVAGTNTKTTANIVSSATAFLAGQQFSNLNIQVYATDTNGNKLTSTTWSSAQFGQGIGVQIDADYAPMLPSFGFLPTTVHIYGKSVMLSEGG